MPPVAPEPADDWKAFLARVGAAPAAALASEVNSADGPSGRPPGGGIGLAASIVAAATADSPSSAAASSGGVVFGRTPEGRALRTHEASERQHPQRPLPPWQPTPAMRAASEDYYALLGLERTASSQEVQRAYFEKACDYHPDLCDHQDIDAASFFRRYSEAFWVLGDPSRRRTFDTSGQVEFEVDLDEIRKAWLWDFAVADPSGVSEMIVESLQCTTEAECLARFEEERTTPVGRIPGERSRCDVCGYQVRGHGPMRAHFAQQHREDAQFWAAGALRHAREAFEEYMATVAGIDAGDFALADGVRTRLQEVGRFPDVHRSVEEELDRTLADDDPCSAQAVHSALRAMSPEALDAMLHLKAKAGAGVANYLAPVEGADPDIAQAAASTQHLSKSQPSTARREGRQATWALQEESPGAASGEPLECVCGFSCGTRSALDWHLARFQQDPRHFAVGAQ